MRRSLTQRLVSRWQLYPAWIAVAVLFVMAAEAMPSGYRWVLGALSLSVALLAGVPELWRLVKTAWQSRSNRSRRIRMTGVACSLIGFPLLLLPMIPLIGLGPPRDAYLGGPDAQPWIGMLGGVFLVIGGVLVAPWTETNSGSKSPASDPELIEG